MASAAQIEVRPRTTGEILDDAWHLYLADAPQLLALSALFTVPLCLSVLCLVTLPPSTARWQQWLWAALTGLALLFTGLGSGACQEAFRLGAEGVRPTVAGCVLASWRRAGSHAAARGLIAACFFLGSWLLFLPGLAVLMSAVAVHAILAAGERNLFAALRVSGREAQRQPVKTGAVILSRFPLLLMGVLNLYLLVAAGFWMAEHLAGLDVALAGLVLSVNNPVYVVALVMLSWLLLAPYFEAANYLLRMDGRARYEGLDLWYRVKRLFPISARSAPGVFVLALGALLLAPVVASAGAGRITAIQDARQKIHSIGSEISSAEPYPGSERWSGRLNGVLAGLEREAASNKGRYRWFHQAIKDFGHRSREGALKVLTSLDRRLSLIEESQPTSATAASKLSLSNEELKKLLPGPQESSLPEDDQVRKRKRPDREEKLERRVEREEREADALGKAEPRGAGVVSAQPQGGFGSLGWLILGGIFVAILIVGLMQLLQGRKQQPAKPALVQTGEASPSLEAILTNPTEYSVTGLWQEADTLARAGQAREAVRTLYLAVLALLHRANLIRFQRTRTNGEYVRQLRSREALRMPFAGITSLFEVKWYGENPCENADYHTCRSLAEQIRSGVTRP